MHKRMESLTGGRISYHFLAPSAAESLLPGSGGPRKAILTGSKRLEMHVVLLDGQHAPGHG